MTDDLEKRLRALRPVPMPAPVQQRIITAVRAQPPRPLTRMTWLPALFAAAVAVAVMTLAQPTAPHLSGSGMDETAVSYGTLLHYAHATADLLDAIDRSHRPIPRFAVFDRTTTARIQP